VTTGQARGIAAMTAWKLAHPLRYRELLGEAVRYSWRTNPKRREHLARVRVWGTAARRRDIDWMRIDSLRAMGLSWRRIRVIVGIPHSTLIQANKRRRRP
jgi:hypothetical protein